MTRPDERNRAGRRPYRGVTPEARDSTRRERLLNAAFQLYAERKTGDVPVAQICRTAGVTTRQFYEVFSDRHALFAAAYERAAEISLAAVVDAVEGRDEAAEAIQAMLVRLFKAEISTDLGNSLFVLFTVGATSTGLRQRRIESIQIAADRLATLLAPMDEKWGDRLRCGILVASIVQVLEVAWLGPGLAEPDAVVDKLMEIFVQP